MYMDHNKRAQRLVKASKNLFYLTFAHVKHYWLGLVQGLVYSRWYVIFKH